MANQRQPDTSLINKAAELIANSKRLVVFTGAGISTESGIPDFRSPGGLWSKYDQDDFTIQKFLRDPETRKKIWHIGRTFTQNSSPNPAHFAIAELEKKGKLDCVITQNVDNLHQRAGNSAEKVLELHGNMRWALCLSCHQRFPMEEMDKKLAEGVEVPPCPQCKGILKPDAVFFGEPLPARVLEEASNRSRQSDVFVVIGSTLVVYPAAYMPLYALDRGARLVIINLSTTPLDQEASIILRGKAGEVMTQIMQRVQELKPN